MLKRYFIGINVGKEAVKEIKKIQKSIKNEFIGKITKTKNLHLTLKFLGEIDENKLLQVKNKLRDVNFNKVEVKLGKVGVFNKGFIRIIWVQLLGISSLQKKIDLSLDGLFKKEDVFMGHITLARVKKVHDNNKFIKEINSLKTNSSFKVNCFYLMESKLRPDGPIYSVIKKYNLT